MLTIKNIEKLRGEVLAPKLNVRWVIQSVNEDIDGYYSYRIKCKNIVGGFIKEVEFALARKTKCLYNDAHPIAHLQLDNECVKDMDSFLNILNSELKTM